MMPNGSAEFIQRLNDRVVSTTIYLFTLVIIFGVVGTSPASAQGIYSDTHVT